jgi:hypothetical protein
MYSFGVLLYVVITFDAYRQIQLARMLVTCERGTDSRTLLSLPIYAACSVPSQIFCFCAWKDKTLPSVLHFGTRYAIEYMVLCVTSNLWACDMFIVMKFPVVNTTEPF